MTAQPRLPKTLVDSIRAALTTNALPGETADFDRKLRDMIERKMVVDPYAEMPMRFRDGRFAIVDGLK